MKKKANTVKVKHIKHKEIQNYALNVDTLNLWFHKHLVLNGGWKFYQEGHTGQDIRVAVLGLGCSPHRRFDEQTIEKYSDIPGENTFDIRNHDTHVISRIIGKSIHANEIITGLAPDVQKVFSYKVIDKNDNLSFDSMFNALDSIRKMDSSTRPHFINMSLGVDISPPWNDDVQQIVNILEDLSKFTRICASSGNSRKWYDPFNHRPLFPAKLPFIKSIGSIDNLKRVSLFSARYKVDYVAYGEDSVGFSNDGISFTTGRGTSFSCPMHVGFEMDFASKLIAERNMHIDDIIINMDELLRVYNMVEDIGIPGNDNEAGAGLLRRL